ncbi:hypothetical protein SMMN14_04563 [Sphaerulina musiva]
MVTTTTTIPVFVNERRTWVVTNIKHYVSRQDIIDYMEQEYPTVYDARRKKNIQNYNVDTRPNGTHRVWAARLLRDDEVKLLEDKNNKGNKYEDDDEDED